MALHTDRFGGSWSMLLKENPEDLEKFIESKAQRQAAIE
jgi:hypothetical protein